MSIFFIGLGGIYKPYPCFGHPINTGRTHPSNLAHWEYAHFEGNISWFGMTFATRWSPGGINAIEVIDNDIM